MDHEHKEYKATSDVLKGVVHNNTGDRITFYDIKNALHERGFGLLIVIFILPLSFPMPYPPGFTTVLIIPVFIFSIQMILGRDSPWLPKWLGKKTVKRTTIAHVIEKASPFLHKLERILRPRFYFANSATGERLVGIACLLFSISVAYPLPLTNLIPSIGILIMALGLLSKDGIVIITGMIVGSIGVAITVIITLLGKKFLMEGMPWLGNLF